MLDTSDDQEELLRQRCILVNGPINDESATQAIAKMLYLQHIDQRSPVTLMIDSPGGSVSASFAILDTMDHISPPVYTTCTGQASGSAANLVAHGVKGHRKGIPRARFQLTTVWGATDTPGEEAQLAEDRRVVIEYLVKDTGRTPEETAINMDRGTALTAQQAVEFGLIDQVL